MSRRTATRSSSRAHQGCPICKKRLAGVKGALSHLAEVHAVAPELAASSYGLKLERKR